MNRNSKKGQQNNNEAGTSAGPKRDRVENWLAQETRILIDAVAQVKVNNGKNDINFKDTHFNEVYTIFKEKLPNSKRTNKNLRTKIKQLKQQYSSIKYLLTNNSGLQWNHTTNKLTVGDDALEDLIQGQDNLKFLRQPFPWFEDLSRLCGTCPPLGNGRGKFGKRTDTQASVNGSSSGSSDTPDLIRSERDRVILENDMENDTVQQEYYGSGSLGQESDNTTMQNSRSSGSKRSSSDTGEPSSRGEKIKKTFNHRTAFFESMRDTNAQQLQLNNRMVQNFEKTMNIAGKKLDILTAMVQTGTESLEVRCVQTLDSMTAIGDDLRFKIIQEFENHRVRLVWLHGTDRDRWRWIAHTFPVEYAQIVQNQNQEQPQHPPFPNHNYNNPQDAYLMNFVGSPNFRPPLPP